MDQGQADRLVERQVRRVIRECHLGDHCRHADVTAGAGHGVGLGFAAGPEDRPCQPVGREVQRSEALPSEQRLVESWPAMSFERYDIASHLQRNYEIILLSFTARRARVA